MKSSLLLLSILLMCIKTHGQNYLTHGQVYNFDIGDVFQIRGETPWNSSYPYKYETRTITNKTYSSGNDTVFYTVNIDTYVPPPASCGTCSAIYTNTTVIQSITQLNDSAITHNNQTSTCMFIGDSIKTDACGNTIWKKYPIPSVSCSSQPTQQSTFLFAGLGGPYYEYYSTAAGLPTYWKYMLIYYSKQVGGTCGVLITSNSKTIKPVAGFSIYPNPTANKLNINSSQGYDIIEALIFDISGRQVLSNIDQKSIDVSKLSAGFYFITIKTDQGEFSQKFIKK